MKIKPKHPLTPYMPEVAPGIHPLQSAAEFMTLLNLYKLLKPKYVVEIGSQKGGTLFHWLKNATKGAHVVSVDCGVEGWKGQNPNFDNSIWQEWAPSGVHLHVVTGDSTTAEIIDQVDAICPRIDFLMIDGRHLYETAKADYENYGKLVRTGGIIALHDIVYRPDKPKYGVWKLWAELKAAGLNTAEMIERPDPVDMGIGVIIK